MRLTQRLIDEMFGEVETLARNVQALIEDRERLRRAIVQLAKDHPDTAVTWPQDGVTKYQELRDWAEYVLGDWKWRP